MATQAQMMQVGAEGVVKVAQEIGETCKLTKGSEALVILRIAYARAIAEAIGPGGELWRQEIAIDNLRKDLMKDVQAQHFLRYGLTWEPPVGKRKWFMGGRG